MINSAFRAAYAIEVLWFDDVDDNHAAHESLCRILWLAKHCDLCGHVFDQRSSLSLELPAAGFVCRPMPRIPYGQRASRMGAICEHCIGTKTDLEIDRDLARQARWWDADDGNMVRVPEHAFDRRVHTVSSPTDPSIVCTVDVFDPYSRAALKDPACDAAADRVFQQLMDANVVAEIPDENAPNGRAVYTAMDCAACGLPFEVRDEFALVFVIRSRDRRWTGAICTDCVREPEKVDGSLMRQALAWLEGR